MLAKLPPRRCGQALSGMPCGERREGASRMLRARWQGVMDNHTFASGLLRHIHVISAKELTEACRHGESLGRR